MAEWTIQDIKDLIEDFAKKFRWDFSGLLLWQQFRKDLEYRLSRYKDDLDLGNFKYGVVVNSSTNRALGKTYLGFWVVVKGAEDAVLVGRFKENGMVEWA